jgi:hypothetical protein
MAGMCFNTRGRTGSSPVYPFGSLATIGLGPKAHSFAPSPLGEFALSRMKGVLDSSRTQEACPRKIHKNWKSGLLIKSRIIRIQSQIL